MSNKFCRYLSNQVRIEYGKLRPCCWYKEEVSIDRPVRVRQLRKEWAAISNFKSANGNCDECQRREHTGQHSPRLQSFVPTWFSDTDIDGDIISLEIQIDNDCNGACLICGPWNSTTWEKYNYKLNNIPVADVPDSDIRTNQYIKQIKNSFRFDQVKSIRFLGGEPLRNNNHLELLKEIPSPENTLIHYTTNGSYRPSAELIATWNKFKQVDLLYSIDGVGEHFNYFRWPLQWNQVESNIQHLIDLDSNVIRFAGFSYTTTPFSLFYHDRYVSWAEEFFKKTSYDTINHFGKPWQPRGQSEMTLSAVPPRLAEAIKNKYGPDHCITKILEPYNPVAHSKFLNYVDFHDQNRKLNWCTVFPEMVEYFK